MTVPLFFFAFSETIPSTQHLVRGEPLSVPNPDPVEGQDLS